MSPATGETLTGEERDAFVAEATAWLTAHADRRPPPAEFAWGRGSGQVALMGTGDEDDPEVALAAARAWRAQVFDAGFGWLGGPEAYGGGGRSPELDRIYRELEAEFDVPDQSAWNVAWEMVAPAVAAHGSEELKARFLAPIYRGDLLCSQLLSEPEGGSDLAGLRTRAVRDGDEWVVNGQKVWSSYAHLAQIGQLMARTDPDVPKHQGISMFLLPLDTPGVEIRPLKQMNGGAEFNEVFLTDVRVPHANMVGEPGGGWRAVLTTLMSERASVGSSKGATTDPVQILIETARHQGRSDDPVIRQELVQAYTVSRVIEYLTLQAEAAFAATGERGAEGSIVKLLSSGQNHRLGHIAGELLGPAMAADTGAWGTYTWSRFLCSAPGLRIAGGTDEIQHNIIGERVLGLPKEPPTP
ncbi:MAG: acyl-CoA dehydrogenase family protein [Acidimicrobiales bacterium]